VFIFSLSSCVTIIYIKKIQERGKVGYTNKVVNYGLNHFVPFGSQFTIGKPKIPISHQEQKNRLHAARAMKKAITEGKLATVDLETVNKMEQGLLKLKAENSFKLNSKIIKEIDKCCSVISYVMPGTRKIVKLATKAGKLANIVHYQSFEGIQRRDVAKKLGWFASSLALSAANSYVLPGVMTTKNIAGAYFFVLGTAYIVDHYPFING
jgi:hypothetical protein